MTSRAWTSVLISLLARPARLSALAAFGAGLLVGRCPLFDASLLECFQGDLLLTPPGFLRAFHAIASPSGRGSCVSGLRGARRDWPSTRRSRQVLHPPRG